MTRIQGGDGTCSDSTCGGNSLSKRMSRMVEGNLFGCGKLMLLSQKCYHLSNSGNHSYGLWKCRHNSRNEHEKMMMMMITRRRRSRKNTMVNIMFLSHTFWRCDNTKSASFLLGNMARTISTTSSFLLNRSCVLRSQPKHATCRPNIKANCLSTG